MEFELFSGEFPKQLHGVAAFDQGDAFGGQSFEFDRSHLGAILLTLALPLCSFGSSHREAPITALDQKADITDFFAFVSYDDPTKVTFILNVDPFLEPGNGPNYFPFDDNILYAIHVDNNNDAKEDISFLFQFQTEIRAPNVFTGFVGAGNGITPPANSPPPVAPGTPIVPPAITALDGAGSQGLSLRQMYTVTMVRNDEGAPLDGHPRRQLRLPDKLRPLAQHASRIYDSELDVPDQ